MLSKGKCYDPASIWICLADTGAEQICTLVERVQSSAAWHERHQQYWIYQQQTAWIEAGISRIQDRLASLRRHRFAYLEQRHRLTEELSAMADDPESARTAALLEADQSLARKIILSNADIANANIKLDKAKEQLPIKPVGYEESKAEFGG